MNRGNMITEVKWGRRIGRGEGDATVRAAVRTLVQAGVVGEEQLSHMTDREIQRLSTEKSILTVVVQMRAVAERRERKTLPMMGRDFRIGTWDMVEKVFKIAEQDTETSQARGPKATAVAIRPKNRREASNTKCKIARDIVRQVYRSVKPTTARSYRSCISSWKEFVRSARMLWDPMTPYFPVGEDVAIKYMATFASSASARNYRAALAWASDVMGIPDKEPWNTKRLARAIEGIDATRNQNLSQHTVIRRDLCRQLVRVALDEGNKRFAAAVVLGYTFLLRMKSEFCELSREVFEVRKDNSVVLSLKQRKNKKNCVYARSCTCEQDNLMCPHCAVVWLYEETAPNEPMYDYNKLLEELRYYGNKCNVCESERMGSHGFRRGAIVDLAETPGTTVEMLRVAGEWSERSQVWQRYAEGAVPIVVLLENDKSE